MGALTAALCSPLAQPGGARQVPKGPRKGRRMATEAGRPPEGGRGQTRVSFLPWVEGCPTEPAAAPSGVWVFGGGGGQGALQRRLQCCVKYFRA